MVCLTGHLVSKTTTLRGCHGTVRTAHMRCANAGLITDERTPRGCAATSTNARSGLASGLRPHARTDERLRVSGLYFVIEEG